MVKISRLEADYIATTLQEAIAWMDQPDDDEVIFESFMNALEIINAAICNNVIDEEIPMSIETWLNPRA
jgi:hypothetical protein